MTYRLPQKVLFYTKYTHPTLICRGTDGRTHGRTDGRAHGRTENIYSIFRDKLLLLGEHGSYIHVPKTSSDQSFQNSKEWLNVAIKVAGTKHGGTFEATYHIATTYSASMETPFLLPARLKDYLCQNRCLQCNFLQ